MAVQSPSRSTSATPTRSSWTYQRPKLTSYQLAALFHEDRYGVVEATTKAGKTVGCMAWLLEQAIKGKAGQNFWWIAPIFSQAEIPYARMKRGLPQTVYQANETKLKITLSNGAVIWFKGADKPDSLYGEDVYAAVIDEAGRCKETAWHAVRSTLTATRGPVRIIGNVKGRRNWAYGLARRAESGEPGWHYAKITAHDAVAAGIIAADEVEDARNTLPDAVFRELYLAEASDDAGNPFGFDAIRACIMPALASTTPDSWGWDLARSTDWTVGLAIDNAGDTCRFERWNQSSLPDTVVHEPQPGESFDAYWKITIARIRTLTGHTAALVDSTGPGGPIDQALSADGHTNIEGYVFTSRSKQLLMEGLAVAIQQKQIRFPSGIITTELEAFEYEYTRAGVKYSAPAGMHDDAVMALALAWQCRSSRASLPFGWLINAPKAA